MKHTIYILTALSIMLFSCERIKNKGKEKIIRTEEKIKNKSKEVVDKVFPQFDSDKPDTEYNKKRFAEYLEIELTSDIKKIYCYGDFLGADYKALFSFDCDLKTIERIINKKGLLLTTDSNDNGLEFTEKFEWWDKDKIESIKAYKNGKENEFWQYLWYDSDNKKAYYEEFSL